MNHSRDFVDGVAYALQQIYDFEAKHGHLHLDGIAANAISVNLRDYAIVFFDRRFEVITRKTPFGETYLAGLL